MRGAIEYLTAYRDEPPDLDRLAGHLGISAAHIRRTLRRWCDLSLEEFAPTPQCG